MNHETRTALLDATSSGHPNVLFRVVSNWLRKYYTKNAGPIVVASGFAPFEPVWLKSFLRQARYVGVTHFVWITQSPDLRLACINERETFRGQLLCLHSEVGSGSGLGIHDFAINGKFETIPLFLLFNVPGNQKSNLNHNHQFKNEMKYFFQLLVSQRPLGIK